MFIGELDPRNIIRNSIHFHDQTFDVLGLRIDGLGNTGITSDCVNKKGERKPIPGKKLVFHHDGKQKFNVGQIIGTIDIPEIKVFGHTNCQVEAAQPLPKQIHDKHIFSDGHMETGFAYVLKPVTSSIAKSKK